MLNTINTTSCNLLPLSIIWSPDLFFKGGCDFFSLSSEYGSIHSEVACVPLLLIFLHSRHMHQSPSTIQWQRLFYNFAICMIKYKLMCFSNKVIQHQRQDLALSLFISHPNKQKQHVYCFYVLLSCSLTGKK